MAKKGNNNINARSKIIHLNIGDKYKIFIEKGNCSLHLYNNGIWQEYLRSSVRFCDKGYGTLTSDSSEWNITITKECDVCFVVYRNNNAEITDIAQAYDVITISKQYNYKRIDNLEKSVSELTKDIVAKSYDDSFYITDSDGNVIFKADKDGISGLNMNGSSNIETPFKGMKLLTIGDSLSAHNNWQKWLVDWIGVVFDNDENVNGKNGHKPMAKGGTAIAPVSEDSIYMRSLDAKYYADLTNGTVIIIYAGQNDSVTLGTIDDIPYTDKTVTTPSNLTFYSSYMGMVENLLADIPSARIYLMTQMPVRLEIGMKGTVSPYEGVVRFPDMASVLAYEAIRYKKVEAIRNIAKKYSLPCIDLWLDSGINDYNSSYWYGAVGGTCGQVHPNNIGYKRMAEVAVAKIY